jgi:transcriptional regulator with XRE-family HTH domain
MIDQIYKLGLDFSKLYPNYFQTNFEMALQKSKEGPKEGPHNQSLKNAIKHLRTIERITQYKDIVEATGYDKSTVSEYARGIVKASAEFETEFEKGFGINLKDYQTPKEGNYNLSTVGVNVTLQDYIDLLNRENDRLFTLLNSTLGRIHEDSHTTLAYQKAWVRYEAERSSGGNKEKEDEIRYKMSKLVDDELQNDE